MYSETEIRQVLSQNNVTFIWDICVLHPQYSYEDLIRGNQLSSNSQGLPQLTVREGILSLASRVVRDAEDWVVAVLGIGLIPIATELTSYYLCVLLGFAALTCRRQFLGALLVGLSALSWGIVEVWHWYDEVFTWTSLAVVAFVLYATAAARPGRDTRSTTKT